MNQILPGVWQIRFGTPEIITPQAMREFPPAADRIAKLPAAEIPFDLEDITGIANESGYHITIPLATDEQIYGLGLQLGSFNQRGKKKMLRVNSDPNSDLGDSHAPVPFYLSTAGYGILVDTARYATFYLGSTQRLSKPVTQIQNETILNTEALYANRTSDKQSTVEIAIPAACGVDIYIFSGPELAEALQRYNLFCGGGAMLPRWGLGIWYRLRVDYSQQQTLEFAHMMRDEQMPCDVIGLEPGWQTHSYPCSFQWSDKFPAPKELCEDLRALGYRLNLWTHAFVHHESPLYQPLQKDAGDYLAFGGLVPDFVNPAVRNMVADFFKKTHIQPGVSGYKLDECDNSDYINGNWSFPEISHFPSGADGEQFHSLFGLLFQQTVFQSYREMNQRTCCEVRSAGALASPYPFVLYSDLYNHRDFIRGVVNAGFCGLLWCPEVRDAHSSEELLRRLQSVILSPQALVNGWYIKNPPWKQWDKDANNSDNFLADYQQLTTSCRKLFELRMQLIPFLHAAFYQYFLQGRPPFRALVIDNPHDEACWNIDDQYMIGEIILAAPIISGENSRKIYLPAGYWVDFWTNERLTGKQWIEKSVAIDEFPLYVKEDSILPLAKITLHTDDPDSHLLTARVYGKGAIAAELLEEDDNNFDYQQGSINTVTLLWDSALKNGSLLRDGEHDFPPYQVIEWQLL